jgi:hypothetical protein
MLLGFNHAVRLPDPERGSNIANCATRLLAIIA